MLGSRGQLATGALETMQAVWECCCCYSIFYMTFAYYDFYVLMLI